MNLLVLTEEIETVLAAGTRVAGIDQQFAYTT